MYNDEQLATPIQMEEMAKAYNEHLNKKSEISNESFTLLSHLFNEAGCLISKLQTKASGNKMKTTLASVHSNLLESAKLFYTLLGKSPIEEEITYAKNFIKCAKQLVICNLEIIKHIGPLARTLECETIINNLVENIKLLIIIA